jgi:hypothetical protein
VSGITRLELGEGIEDAHGVLVPSLGVQHHPKNAQCPAVLPLGGERAQALRLGGCEAIFLQVARRELC